MLLHRLAAPLLTALATLAAAPAWACGGFFCSQQPVDQSAERILYLQDHGKVTVHIQISYTGDAENFSWVLPLQKQPTLGIGSDTVFQILEQATAPTFQLDWKQNPNCYGGGLCMEAAASGGPPNADNDSGTKGVKVLAQQNVGPYDTVVLQGETGKAVVEWLTQNGYQQPAATAPLIDLYAKQKYVFLALKLLKDKGAGDLAPIVVTLPEASPCLPLRLTQLAAKPDMPIVAWVVGEHRAIPKNFLHVELNDATLDWLQPGTNYKTVVSKAVDQGSGHAFTTEYAQPTTKLGATFVDPTWQPAELAKNTTASKFLMALLEKNYPRSSQMQNLVRKYIPKPKAFEAVADQQFYNCLSCNGCEQSAPCSDYHAAVKAQPFDADKFAKDVEELIVKPLGDVQTAVTKLPYMTRLYTTVSPEEMDKDPIFAFNATLPTVDRVHKASAEALCEPGVQQASKVKLTFADGHQLTVPVSKTQGFCGGFGIGGSTTFGKGDAAIVEAGGQPARKVQVLDEQGAPLDIHPADADRVDAELNAASVGKTSLSAEFRKGLAAAATWDYKKPGLVVTSTPPKTPATPPADEGGCTAAPTSAAGPWTLLGGLGLLAVALLRRRGRNVAG